MMIKGISSTLMIWDCFLQWRSKGFTLPRFGTAFCNDDQGDLLYLDLGLPFATSQNFKLDFTDRCFMVALFLRCVTFICSLLIWIFIKKSLIEKIFYFWERFDLWYLKFLKLIYKLWDFENWNFDILRLGIWSLKLETWDYEFEIWNLKEKK